MKLSEEFSFGLETEYMLVDAETYAPLWHRELNFHELDHIFANVPNLDISKKGLKSQPPHSIPGHYLVEGYHCFNERGKALSILPKGIEIRTSICETIDQTVSQFNSLYKRLSLPLLQKGYRLCSVSFHPRESEFFGEQNHRNLFQWCWAQRAMCTYGPDFNIQIPQSILTPSFWKNIREKVNHYAPALAAASFCSPFFHGKLWTHLNFPALSARTFQRCKYAPLFEYHIEENGRFECNIFEMPTSLAEIKVYFLLWLTLLIDTQLKGRSTDSTSKNELCEVAIFGLSTKDFSKRGLAVIDAAFGQLPRYGIDPSPLLNFRKRFEQRWCPSLHLQNIFWETGTIEATLFHRCELIEDGWNPSLESQLTHQELIYA
ncbi:MAG: glutamate-cysteine ligase family protein [Deltaproteobacteria bacterium]